LYSKFQENTTVHTTVLLDQTSQNKVFFSWRNNMEEQVRKAIEDVRPSLQADGGDVKFVGVTEDGVVSVQLQGACNGCPMAQLTLKQGIEKYLKETVPGVTSVESV